MDFHEEKAPCLPCPCDIFILYLDCNGIKIGWHMPESLDMNGLSLEYIIVNCDDDNKVMARTSNTEYLLNKLSPETEYKIAIYCKDYYSKQESELSDPFTMMTNPLSWWNTIPSNKHLSMRLSLASKMAFGVALKSMLSDNVPNRPACVNIETITYLFDEQTNELTLFWDNALHSPSYGHIEYNIANHGQLIHVSKKLPIKINFSNDNSLAAVFDNNVTPNDDNTTFDVNYVTGGPITPSSSLTDMGEMNGVKHNIFGKYHSLRILITCGFQNVFYNSDWSKELMIWKGKTADQALIQDIRSLKEPNKAQLYQLHLDLQLHMQYYHSCHPNTEVCICILANNSLNYQIEFIEYFVPLIVANNFKLLNKCLKIWSNKLTMQQILQIFIKYQFPLSHLNAFLKWKSEKQGNNNKNDKSNMDGLSNETNMNQLFGLIRDLNVVTMSFAQYMNRNMEACDLFLPEMVSIPMTECQRSEASIVMESDNDEEEEKKMAKQKKKKDENVLGTDDQTMKRKINKWNKDICDVNMTNTFEKIFRIWKSQESRKNEMTQMCEMIENDIKTRKLQIDTTKQLLDQYIKQENDLSKDFKMKQKDIETNKCQFSKLYYVLNNDIMDYNKSCQTLCEVQTKCNNLKQNHDIAHLKLKNLDSLKEDFVMLEQNDEKFKQLMIDKWKKFEKQWKKWNHRDICFWIKAKMGYFGKITTISNNNNNDEFEKYINFDKIDEKLKDRDIKGAFLTAFDESYLGGLGFDSPQLCTFIMNEIKQLTAPNIPDNHENGKNNSQIESTNNVENDDQDAMICKICWDQKINVVLNPCGHACMCRDCGNEWTDKECPMCRKNIESIINLFL